MGTIVDTSKFCYQDTIKMPEAVTKFVSQKISKVRWQPTSKQVVQESDLFATGSWDDDGQLSSPEGEPQLLCQAVHAGDVTDMTFTTPEHILASSSNGSLTAYRYNPRTQTLSASYSWSNLHHHTQPGLTGQCACTGVTSRGEEAVVTVGEDGSITLLNMDQRQPVRVIERADSCSLHAVTFLKHSEAATVNAIGQLKVWDMRQAGNEP